MSDERSGAFGVVKCTCDAAMWRKQCEDSWRLFVKNVERLKRARRQRDEARALADRLGTELTVALARINALEGKLR